MGRAGGGSGGGGGHSSSGSFGSSGGGHSFGSSSGGHTFGSSGHSGHTRAGGGSSHYDDRGFEGHYGSSRYYGGLPTIFSPFRFYGYGGIVQNVISRIVTLIIVFVFLAIIASAKTGGSSSVPASTIQRNKLTGVPAYSANCILDELGYFDDTGQAERGLKDFYNKTGVQPYIYIKDYDASLVTNEDKEAYAKEYFDSNIDQANGFLFIYFANEDEHDDSIPDYDKSIGYMCYTVGTSAKAVMDDEAVNIFWAYIDKYWTSDLSMEDMITTVFSDTADSIMKVSKTSSQISGMTIVFVLAVITVVLVIVMINLKRKAEAEKAKHTQDILNTPIDDLDKSRDDTVDKYL